MHLESSMFGLFAPHHRRGSDRIQRMARNRYSNHHHYPLLSEHTPPRYIKHHDLSPSLACPSIDCLEALANILNFFDCIPAAPQCNHPNQSLLYSVSLSLHLWPFGWSRARTQAPCISCLILAFMRDCRCLEWHRCCVQSDNIILITLMNSNTRTFHKPGPRDKALPCCSVSTQSAKPRYSTHDQLRRHEKLIVPSPFPSSCKTYRPTHTFFHICIAPTFTASRICRPHPALHPLITSPDDG